MVCAASNIKSSVKIQKIQDQLSFPKWKSLDIYQLYSTIAWHIIGTLYNLGIFSLLFNYIIF